MNRIAVADSSSPESLLADEAPILEVRDLEVAVEGKDGLIPLVRGISYDVKAGSTVAVVGESGSGKTVSALALVRLLSGEFSTNGSVRLEGRELTTLDERSWRQIRGGAIGFVFQDAMNALNPLRPIGRQIAEGAQIHLQLSRQEAMDRSVDLLAYTGIPDPKDSARKYPHELSGGMRQRALIALALAGEPRVLIADEPTSSLDVTVQAQILELFRRLSAERTMALVLISHDLGVVAGLAESMAVMYAGKIVEYGAAGDVLHRSRHPYTQGLMKSRPRLRRAPQGRLSSIEGVPPLPLEVGDGCSFAPRCPDGIPRCSIETPLLEPTLDPSGEGHLASCWVQPRV